MSETFRIAGAQIDIQLGNKTANLAHMIGKMEEAAAASARLVIFPECALTGYCFDSFEEGLPYAEPIPGESTEQMQRVCQRLNLHVVYGLLERCAAEGGPKMFNAAALVGPAGLVASYRKIHLPHLGVDHFVTPGDRPFAVHDLDGVRVGLNICYDSAFPESARVMSLLGADLIILPTNFPPGAECVIGHVIHARAMENGVYFAAVNRIGNERGFEFLGGSKICDPDGHAVATAGVSEEALIYADLDVRRSRDKQRVRAPGRHSINRFTDRRPEMYGRLVE
ncbi:MAG: carbon-nitrogen hydrolase family protein [Planctomycetota bacterium]|nr:carbon-nitrogen hydrolase family protein [Planctomycetota bacterium]MDA1178216.1 carbon-nitrogen hydrolase family protein [Planctomycetota bacterium]